MDFTVQFLHNFEDPVPPSEACLSGHINWSLVQAQHHSSLVLSQFPTSLRGDRTRPRADFKFSV